MNVVFGVIDKFRKKTPVFYVSTLFFKINEQKFDISVFRLINDSQVKPILVESLRNFKEVELRCDPQEKKVMTPAIISQVKDRLVQCGVHIVSAHRPLMRISKTTLNWSLGGVIVCVLVWLIWTSSRTHSMDKPLPVVNIAHENQIEKSELWEEFLVALDGPILIEQLSIDPNTLTMTGVVSSGNVEKLPEWITQYESKFQGRRLAFQLKRRTKACVEVLLQGVATAPKGLPEKIQSQTGHIAFDQIPFWINETGAKLKNKSTGISKITWSNRPEGISYEIKLEK